MHRAALLAIVVSTPLLMAVAPMHAPIVITGDLGTARQNPELCHVRLGMTLSEPAVGAVILNLRVNFGTGMQSENVRLLPNIPGQWTWHDVLFHGDCANPVSQPVIHVQEAVCATWVKYVDCLPQVAIKPGTASLQIP